MATEEIKVERKLTTTEKFWKLTAVGSLTVTVAVLILGAMLYTRKGLGDVFWPEERIVSTARNDQTLRIRILVATVQIR